MSPFALSLVAMLTAGQTPAEYSPRVGEPHPSFVLPRIDDREPMSLADLRGHKTLLIHFASW